MVCTVALWPHLQDVPSCFKTDWAAANTTLLEYIIEANERGDADAETRGLKWYLLLADVLLRGKRRGERRQRCSYRISLN